jgi:hypothetical protein
MKFAEEVQLAMDESMKNLVAEIWYVLLEAMRDHGGNITLDDVVKVIWDERDNPVEVACEIAVKLASDKWRLTADTSVDESSEDESFHAAVTWIRAGRHLRTRLIAAHQ